MLADACAARVLCPCRQYRMPLIRSVPFFINAPQFDMFELMYDTGTTL